MLNVLPSVFETDLKKILGIVKNNTPLRDRFTNFLKPFIADLYQQERENIILKREDPFTNEIYPYMRANIHFRVSDSGIIFCDTLPFYEEYRENYQIEVSYIRWITNAPYIDFCAIIGAGERFHVKRYEENRKLEEFLIEKVKADWEEKRKRFA